MYCPKCHNEFRDEHNEYCPKCGYKLSDYKKDILDKFDKKHKNYYNIMIILSFVIALLALILIFLFKDYFYIFLIFPCVSYFLDRYLARQIGLIDTENTPELVIKYLKKTSLLVGITNALNTATIVTGIVFILQSII